MLATKTVQEALEKAKEYEKNSARVETNQYPCPNCGFCPTCGRPNYYFPWYPYPTYISWSSTG